jgi:glycosyltransferase involved in cell wall biosynthesis
LLHRARIVERILQVTCKVVNSQGDGVPEDRESGTLKGKTVCYVSAFAFGGVYRTLKQARSAAEAGARVVFVAYENLMPQQMKDSGFECIGVKNGALTASTNRIWLVRVALNLTFHRVRNWYVMRYRGGPLVRGVVSTGADVVQAASLPALEYAHMAALKLGARLVYDGNELWTGFLKNPAMAADPEWSARLLEMKRRLIPKADLVLAVSDVMGDRLVERYPIRRPLTILNSPPDRVLVAQSVSDPVRLVFHGGLSSDRNIDGLIRAMSHLRGRATLDVHGFSRTVDQSALQELVDELGLSDVVRLYGAYDYEGVIELLRDYDIGVMANRIFEENFEIALPNKLFDSMCAGLAVALTGSEAVRPFIESTGCGITLDPSTPETIARDLGALVNDPERIMRMKEAAVEAAPRYWWPEQGRKLNIAYEDMLRPD